MSTAWKVLVVVFIIVSVVLGILLWKTRATANNIHTFLGTNKGSNPTQWTGYLGVERQNNEDLRKKLGHLACRVDRLEKSKPNDCGPEPGGPPGTVPKDDGSYPP